MLANTLSFSMKNRMAVASAAVAAFSIQHLPTIRSTRCSVLPYLQPRFSVSTFSASVKNISESMRSSSREIKFPSSNKTSTTVDANELFTGQKEMKLSAGYKGNRPQSSRDDEPFDICLSSEGEFLEPCCIYEERNRVIDHENYLIQENGQVLGDGIILLRNYIPLDEQVDIVKRCRKLGLGRGGFYRPINRSGTQMRLYMMCLGLHWDPITRVYQKIRQHDGAEPPSIPNEFSSLVKNAIGDSHTLIRRHFPTSNPEDILPRTTPDLCLVNYYNTNGGLAFHRDNDESRESMRRGLPIVSVSLGDSAEFIYNKHLEVSSANKVVLKSGDVLIFGGKSRNIYHGVTSIIPNTTPPLLLERAKLRPGRLNLTFRKY